MKKYGCLVVGFCCVMLVGKFFYKNVIYIVGLIWYDYDVKEKKLCFNDV